MELTEEDKFRLLTANENHKWQTYVCLLQPETENRVWFPRSANNKTLIEKRCFSKRDILRKLSSICTLDGDLQIFVNIKDSEIN